MGFPTLRTTTLDRRTFLARTGAAGAAATAAAVLPATPRAAFGQEATLEPFFHGVASGEPLPDGVVIWTRVTPPEGHDGSPIDVAWQVCSDVDLTDVVASGTFAATEDEDWTVHVDVTGLEAYTYYFYGFEALGGVSLTGRTKTAPARGQAGVDRLRFGVVSCSNYEAGFFNAYRRLAERNDIDCVFALGDYVYEYEQGHYGMFGEELGRLHQPPVEMITLAHYRGRYAHYHLDPDLRRLHQLHPFINTWDDHETTNDSWREGAENHQDGEGNYEDRKGFAQQAWREWLPTRLPDPSRIYRSYQYGDLADLVWMDTRIEGRDEIFGGVLNPQNPVVPIDDPDREMISQAQRDVVYSALTESKEAGVTWRILCQQVMMMQWNSGGVPDGIAGTDFPSFVLTEGGYRVNPDAWDGYPAERRRLYDHLLDNDIDNIVTLTGDIHSCWAADLTTDPYDPLVYDPTGLNPLIPRNVGVEFVGSSVTSDNVDEIVMSQGGDRNSGIAAAIAIEEGTKADNPHIKMVELRNHGYFVLDVTADRVQSDFYFVPILEQTSDESHFQSWYCDVDTHRVQQGSELTSKSVDAAVPAEEPPTAPQADPTATESPTESPTETPTPTPTPEEDAEDQLPATGGGAIIGGLAAIGAAAALRRRRGED